MSEVDNGVEWISAAEANRRFSRLLSAVRRGRRFVVTSHGKPVAYVAPAQEIRSARAAARRALIDRLRHQRPTDIGSWRRDDLYERHDETGA